MGPKKKLRCPNYKAKIHDLLIKLKMFQDMTLL